MWPLTIRLPSKRMFFCLGTPLGTPQTGLARLRRAAPHAQIVNRVYPSAFSPQRPSLPAVFSGFSGSRYPWGPQNGVGVPRVAAGVPKASGGVPVDRKHAAAQRQPPGRGEGRVSHSSGDVEDRPSSSLNALRDSTARVRSRSALSTACLSWTGCAIWPSPSTPSIPGILKPGLTR